METTKLLVKKGWKVYGLSRSKPKFEDKNFVFLECNVTKSEQLKKAQERIKEPIDLLVPNAGIRVKGKLVETSEEDFDKMMDITLKGVYLTLKTFLPKMLEREKGHVIVTSSKVGLGPSPGNTVYTAAKHAVQGLIKSMKQDCAEKNVKMTLICPGGVDTHFREQSNPEYLDPKEIAEIILFIVERQDKTLIDQVEITPMSQAKTGKY